MRRLAVGLLVTLAAVAPAAAQTADDGVQAVGTVMLPGDVESMPDSLKGPRPPMDIPAVSSVIIRDLTTGVNIVEREPGRLMVPASVMKSVTAAATLIDGRGDDRFDTKVYTQGAVADGKLFGNLVVLASGDPTTDSRRFIGNHGLADSIASRLKVLGVDTVCGQIVFDTSRFPADGPSPFWQKEDLVHSYGCGHYSINYKDNTVDGTSRAMADPPGVFYDAVDSALRRRDIYVADDNITALPGPRLLYSQQSPKIREILHDMMVRSDNLFAEAMLRAMAPGHRVEDAVRREKYLLSRIGVDTTGVTIRDGSGLARANGVTADFIADVLQKMAASRWCKEYTDLFPRAGVNGTVRRVLAGTPLAGKVILKSGSMRGIQAWAGYKLDDSGRPTHAVVFLMNNITCERSRVVKEAERVMLEAFGFTEADRRPEE